MDKPVLLKQFRAHRQRYLDPSWLKNLKRGAQQDAEGLVRQNVTPTIYQFIRHLLAFE
jgi:hypothetical protein